MSLLLYFSMYLLLYYFSIYLSIDLAIYCIYLPRPTRNDIAQVASPEHSGYHDACTGGCHLGAHWGAQWAQCLAELRAVTKR